MVAKTKDPVTFVRLHPRDRKEAAAQADRLGMPLSTWMRMVILDRIEVEKAKREVRQ